jgi:YidC/Oxa1 family membrane protein insertase
MDRKAWIVVTLCIIGIAFNEWYGAQNQIPPPLPPVPAATETASDTAAAPSPATPAPTAADTSTAAKPSAPAVPEQTHEITSGTVTYTFSNKGGGIQIATLRHKGVIVLNEHGQEPIGALRKEAKSLDDTVYEMKDATATSVTFTGTTRDNIGITKTYRLTEGDKSDEHLLALSITLTNPGAAPFRSEQYYLYAGAANSLQPDDIQHPSFFWNDSGNAKNHDTNWFGSGWFAKNPTEYSQKYENLRWGGVMSRFYAHIISTKEGVENQPGQLWAGRFLVDHSSDEFKDMSAAQQDYAVQGAVGLPPIELSPGESKTLEYEIYLGPKEYNRLRDIERQRRFVMFYGMFSFISRTFINLLNWLHDTFGSWGLAIVLLTIIVRIFLWPFHAKSQRAMKRMGKLAPLMKEVQEKYKDDQQRQSQEMMKLYKDYGVNPIGGCIPILFQIPIFFGFFSMLGAAAELRGEPFLWVKDLSLADTVTHIFGFPLNPLPIVMGITMWLQMKLTPQPATVDKMQQRIFMLMPFMFLIFCYASALALYWTTQNIFSILQSWIMKKMGTDDDGPLQKVQRVPMGPPPANPFALPGQKHKDKNKLSVPRLGGGGSRSKGNK